MDVFRKVLLAASAAVAAFAASAETWTDVLTGYTWTYSGGTILGFDQSSNTLDRVLTVPQTLGGTIVTKLGTRAFSGNTNLVEVVLPSAGTVKNVDASAFQGCTKFRSIRNLPTGVTSLKSTFPDHYAVLEHVSLGAGFSGVGGKMFADCAKLESVDLPADGSVNSIAKTAFDGCTSLRSLTGLPSSVTDLDAYFPGQKSTFTNLVWAQSVGDVPDVAFTNFAALVSIKMPGAAKIGFGAFAMLENLKSVDLGTAVKTLDKYAFVGCTSLTTVKLGSGVTDVGDAAFGACEALTDVSFTASTAKIGEGAFAGCLSLTTLPAGQQFGAEAFSGCTALETAVFDGPSPVTAGDGVCSGCTALKTVTIRDSVTSLGVEAFDGCTALTSVTLAKSIGSVPERAFRDCTALPNVAIAEGIAAVGASAFEGCTNLTAVAFPSTLKTIGNDAFLNCESLVAAAFPAALTNVSDFAFRDCERLATVTFGGTGAKVAATAFDGCPHVRSVVACAGALPLSTYFNDSFREITSVGFVSGMTSVPAQACSGCTRLTTVDFPSAAIAEIGDSAFAGCYYLQTATLPETVRKICANAFQECGSMESVYLPLGLESVDATAFDGCSGIMNLRVPPCVTNVSETFSSMGALTNLVFGDGCKSLAATSLANCGELVSVHLPASMASVAAGAFASCGSLERIEVADGNAVYSSSDGLLYDKAKTSLQCCPPGITTVTLPETVTKMPAYPFQGCTRLKYLSLSPGVAMSALALEPCTALEEFHAYALAEPLRNYFGQNLASVTEIVVHHKSPDDVIPEDYCAYFPRIRHATIDEGYVTLSARAFQECVALREAILPSTLKTIGDAAFSGCISLESLAIPAGVTSIGEDVLNGCSNLKNLELPDSISTVSSGLFAGCESLTRVAFGVNVTTLGAGVFDGCTQLTNVTFNAAQLPTCDPAAFDGVSAAISVTATFKGGTSQATIPKQWLEDNGVWLFKKDYSFPAVLNEQSGFYGKTNALGQAVLLWEDYVAGNDPRDDGDVVLTTITIVDGQIVLGVHPDAVLDAAKFRLYGKKDLWETTWTDLGVAKDATQETIKAYRFFKVAQTP